MKKRFLRLFAIILVICMLICGCNDVVKSPNLMNNVSAGDVSEIPLSAPGNSAVTDFALRLFKAGNEDGKNTLISPLSVLAALSMTANGAKGDTLAEMENVLGMPVSQLNGYMHSYLNSLPQGEKYKLFPANSIWFTDDNRFTVNEDFLQTNADYFGADIYKSPFDDTTLKDINNWVKQNTDGMIPEILDEIPDNAIMYLVNALAFEAEWSEIYTKDAVSTGSFTTENGTKQEVEFMYSTENKYIEDENATGFIKYYKDEKYAFVALLPNDGITVSEYLDSLNGEYLAEMLANPQNMPVNTAIPKFETEYDTDMAELLASMGMPKAFDPSAADFSSLGTSSAGNIYIGRVLHKTFISVGEKGTKAGAATSVEMQDECAPEYEETKKIYLDRPFVYMLIDCKTNIPFFMGTLLSVNEVPETEMTNQPFEAQYIRTDGYHDEFEYPIMKVIRSVEDLNAHYEEYKDYFLLDGGGLGNPPTFKEACEKYDKDYFEKNILLLVLLEEGSGSIRHEVKSVKTSGNNVEIDIDVTCPEVCTEDMAEWHVIIELDRDCGIDYNDNIKVNRS